jgi:hypothetical protein
LEIQLINTKVSSLDNRLREIYSEIQDFLWKVLRYYLL